MAQTTIVSAQTETPKSSRFYAPTSIFWLNTYGNIKLSDKFYWVVQTHFRTVGDDKQLFVNRMAQQYNRHAISYKFSSALVGCFGGVVRLNFGDTEEFISHRIVPEWRIWQELQFSVPVGRNIFYHRIRVEQRWSKSVSDLDSDYIYRNRWRYMFRMKRPLNRSTLTSKTWYYSPEVELIMQSGKPVVNSPFEDLRITNGIGYIVSSKLSFAGGFMYAFGQQLSDGSNYNQKLGIRLHVYYYLDFTRKNSSLPNFKMIY
jgi:hypothetical protein